MRLTHWPIEIIHAKDLPAEVLFEDDDSGRLRPSVRVGECPSRTMRMPSVEKYSGETLTAA